MLLSFLLHDVGIQKPTHNYWFSVGTVCGARECAPRKLIHKAPVDNFPQKDLHTFE